MNSRVANKVHEHPCSPDELSHGELLIAELDHADSGSEQLGDERYELRFAVAAVDEHAKCYFSQAIDGVNGAADGGFERVEPISQGLKGGCLLGSSDLAEFFEAAERLLGTLKAGLTHGPGVGACGFAERFDLSTHVVRRVARSEAIDVGEHLRGSSQVVPQSLDEARQMRVVEDKTHVVFDDAQSLCGAVERGVEYAVGRHGPGLASSRKRDVGDPFKGAGVGDDPARGTGELSLTDLAGRRYYRYLSSLPTMPRRRAVSGPRCGRKSQRRLRLP
jgi:hypothetical protein